MCIAFDGANLLEPPITHPATTDEHDPIPELPTDDADVGSAERPVPLDFVIR